MYICNLHMGSLEEEGLVGEEKPAEYEMGRIMVFIAHLAQNLA